MNTKRTELDAEQLLVLWEMNRSILNVLSEVKADEDYKQITCNNVEEDDFATSPCLTLIKKATKGNPELPFLWHLNEFTKYLLQVLMSKKAADQIHGTDIP